MNILLEKLKNPTKTRLVVSIVLFFFGFFVLVPAIALQVGASIPDATFLLTRNTLSSFLSLYTEEQIHAYIVTNFTTDLIWPLLYTCFLLTLFYFLTKKERKGFWLPLLICTGFILDLLENLFISLYLISPSVPLSVLSVFSQNLKWLVIALVSLSLFFLLLGILIKKR